MQIFRQSHTISNIPSTSNPREPPRSDPARIRSGIPAAAPASGLQFYFWRECRTRSQHNPRRATKDSKPQPRQPSSTRGASTFPRTTPIYNRLSVPPPPHHFLKNEINPQSASLVSTLNTIFGLLLKLTLDCQGVFSYFRSLLKLLLIWPF